MSLWNTIPEWSWPGSFHLYHLSFSSFHLASTSRIFFGGRNPPTLKPPQLACPRLPWALPSTHNWHDSMIPPSSSSSFFVAWASFTKMTLMRKKCAPLSAFRDIKLNKLHQHRLSMLGSKGGTTATRKQLNFDLFHQVKSSNSTKFSLQTAFFRALAAKLWWFSRLLPLWGWGMSASEGRC